MTTPHLGTLRATYNLPREEFYQALLVFIVVGGLSIAYVLAMLVVFALAGRRGEVLVLAGVIVALMSPLILRFLRYGGRLYSWRTMRVYDGGFVLSERGQTVAAAWDDLDSYYVKGLRLGVDYLRESDAAQMSARIAYTLTLNLKTGQRVEIDTAVRQMRDVIEGIGRRYALHHFELTNSRIVVQGRYVIGDVIIEADRMTHNDIGYRWYQLEKVIFDYVGDLIVEQGGAPRPRPVLPIEKIPNPHLLMLLLSPHTTVLDFSGRPVAVADWRKSVLLSES